MPFGKEKVTGMPWLLAESRLFGRRAAFVEPFTKGADQGTDFNVGDDFKSRRSGFAVFVGYLNGVRAEPGLLLFGNHDTDLSLRRASHLGLFTVQGDRDIIA